MIDTMTPRMVSTVERRERVARLMARIREERQAVPAFGLWDMDRDCPICGSTVEGGRCTSPGRHE
jgi:hypothetical protein